MKHIILTIGIIFCMAILINGNPTENDPLESSMKQVEKVGTDVADKLKKTVDNLAESTQNVVNKTADNVNNMVDKMAEEMPKISTFNKSSALHSNTIISLITSVCLIIGLNQF